jgi:hypothetical protein
MVLELSLMEDTDLFLLDTLLKANRESASLDELRIMEAGRRRRLEAVRQLVVSGTTGVPVEDNLRPTGRLLDEVHRQASTSHPGRNRASKTCQSKGMNENINCRKCHVCRWLWRREISRKAVAYPERS